MNSSNAGLGWLTINLLNAHFYGVIDEKDSSVQLPPGCNPFVKLFVNGEKVKESPKRKDKILHDVDITFETTKIPKNSTIKLEIWDASSILWVWASDELIFSTEGDIESFLDEPFRKGIREFEYLDSIETMSFWINEYK